MNWKELKKEFKVLKSFYLIFFFGGLTAFVSPFWIIYFNEIGLSFTQIAIILSINSLASLIFEVPTGAIADLFGRKPSLALGMLLAGLLFLVVPLTNSFLVLSIIFFAFGGVTTLISGADTAWIVDYLKHKRKQNLIHAAFARTQSLASFGTAFTFALAGFLAARYALKHLWVVNGVMLLILSAVIMLIGKEHFVRKVKKGEIWSKTFKTARKGATYTIKKYNLLMFMIATFFLAFGGIGIVLWQPFFRDAGLPVHYLGYLFSILVILGAILPNFSKALLSKMGSEKHAIVLSRIVLMAALIIVGITLSLYTGIAAFLIAGAMVAIVSPIRVTYFHSFVPSRLRATIGSFKSWVGEVGAIVALISAGYVMDNFGYSPTFMLAAVMSIPAIIAFWRINDESN